LKVYKEAVCPGCGKEQWVVTTNLSEKRKECSNCGQVRDLKIKEF